MDSRVYDAAQNGDVNRINVLFVDYPELLREVTFEKNNVIHIAARREGHFHFVEWILNHVKGSRSMCVARNSHGNMPLHEASQTGDADLVSILMSFRDIYGFIIFLVSSNLTITLFGLKYLIETRFQELNALHYWRAIVNEFGETPLLLACKYGREDAARLLLEASTPISLLWPEYQACLHVAAYEGHLGVVRLLLNKSTSSTAWSEVLFRSDAHGANPLHTSVYGRRIDVVREILNYPLTSYWRRRLMTMTDGHGRCAIHVAVVKGSHDIVNEFMSSTRYSIEIRSADYKTVLHFAVAHGRHLLVQQLLSNKSQYEVVKLVSYDHDKFGNTALHLAAPVDPQIVKYLLSFPGVNVNALNNEGFTPLDVAVGASSSNATNEIIRILEDAGASANYTAQTTLTKTIELLSDEKIEKDDEVLDAHTADTANNVETLVASLVATVTFQAIFQVPGGIDDDRNSLHYGVARLAFEHYFTPFLVYDIVALFTSLAVVMVWLFRERLKKRSGVYKSMQTYLSTMFLGISIVCTVIAFTSAVYLVIIPRNVKALKTTNTEAFYRYFNIYLLVDYGSFFSIMFGTVGVSWYHICSSGYYSLSSYPPSRRELRVMVKGIVPLFIMYVTLIPFLLYQSHVRRKVWGHEWLLSVTF